MILAFVLIMSYSNAGKEHLYSLVIKIKNEGSNMYSLYVESSLSAVLAVQINKNEAFSKYYDFRTNKTLLKEPEEVTTNSNIQ